MPTRKPAPKTKKPTAHQRIANAWLRHPIATLLAVAGAVGTMVSAAPAVIWALHYYETTYNADAREVNIRLDIAKERISNNRTNAWQTMQGIKNETILLRNRVNDCDIATSRQKSMTELERTACTQYRAELDDATRRYNESRAAALSASKEK